MLCDGVVESNKGNEEGGWSNLGGQMCPLIGADGNEAPTFLETGKQGCCMF